MRNLLRWYAVHLPLCSRLRPVPGGAAGNLKIAGCDCGLDKALVADDAEEEAA